MGDFCREQVQQFAKSMEYRLRAFDGKKSMEGVTFEFLLERALANMAKASLSLHEDGPRLRSLVDAANFLMFAAGLLEEGCDEGRPASCLMGEPCLDCCDPESCE